MGQLSLATLVTVLICMGRHFEILNRILFDYFPMYNNFRAHNSVMAVTALFLPFLGVLALQKLYEGKVDSAEFKKAFYWSTGISAGLCLFFALLGPGIFILPLW
ncbi:MAG: hypothetical protein R2784_10900 [Saprospiraceae bacterium]